MRILVTGAAGFIGFHLCRRLIADGHEVAGLDGMTAYYDVALKDARLALLRPHNRFTFDRTMLEDADALGAAFQSVKPEIVVHLAAQAGVRYSLEHPRAYVDANLVGAFNVLEQARALQVRHLLFASTSSIYGVSEKRPFEELDRADYPLTLYAASKKAGELISHAQSHLWGYPHHGVPILHGLRTLGPARHVALAVRGSHLRRRSDRCLRARRGLARLHLHR